MKKNKVDYISCLNISFFAFAVLLLLFVVFLSFQPTYRKDKVILKLIYATNATNTNESARITSESFKSSRLPLKASTEVQTASGDNKSYSRLIKADTLEIPVNYTEIIYPGMELPIYTFISEDGSSQYRMYVERETNGIISKGYIKAKQKLDGLKIKYDYDINSKFIDIKSEKFGEITPVDASTEITGDLVKVFGYTGLYYNQNNGNKEYYIYGYYMNREPGFFIANSSGSMIPGTLPVEISNKE